LPTCQSTSSRDARDSLVYLSSCENGFVVSQVQGVFANALSVPDSLNHPMVHQTNATLKEEALPLALLAPQTPYPGQPRGREAVANEGPHWTPPARHTQGRLLCWRRRRRCPAEGGLSSASARRPNSCHFMPTPRRSVGPGRGVQHSALPCFIAVHAGHRCRAHTQRGHLIHSASSLAGLPTHALVGSRRGFPARRVLALVQTRLVERGALPSLPIEYAGVAVVSCRSIVLLLCLVPLWTRGGALADQGVGSLPRLVRALLSGCTSLDLGVLAPSHPVSLPRVRAAVCTAVHIGVCSNSEATWSLWYPTAGLRR